MEPPFDKIDGVISTTSGYSGGPEKDPTYKQVSSGSTGHTEVVQVLYDPAKVSYEQLLEVFWRNIDPRTENRQFCDWGSQYRTGVFFHDAEQGRLAEASKQKIEDSGQIDAPIVTEITAFTALLPGGGSTTRTSTRRTRCTTSATAPAAAGMTPCAGSGVRRPH